MIEIKNLKKSYGKLLVLNNININIESGKVTAILGPNSSGKTTLIKCILGLVIPQQGDILINNLSIKNNYSWRSLVGYMPQITRFPENLTLQELLYIFKDLRGTQTKEKELITNFGLSKFLNKPLRVLSGGTRQKINIVLALMFNPAILILDEPTAGLDPLASTLLKDKIKLEKQKGKTVVITSHLMSEVEELADKLIFLLEGKIIFAGTLSEIKEKTKENKLERALAKIMEKQNNEYLA